jgi:hypothetical protein
MRAPVERRLELLEMEGNGFNQSEIVKHLAKKHQVSDRSVYYDFQKKDEWQPVLQQLKDKEKILLKIVNRYEHIYRKAAFKYLQANNDAIAFAALKTMLAANTRLYECLLPERAQQKVETEITQSKPFIIKKWSREDADNSKA